MIDFFIALFGGLYYIGKIGTEKRNERRWHEKQNARAMHIESLKSLVTDSDLERSIRDMVDSQTNDAAIYRDLKDNLIAIFGSDYMAAFPIREREESKRRKVYNNAYWAKQLLMSKQGKVCFNAFYGGFYLGDSKEETCRNILICRQIEKNLLDSGTGLKLYREPICGYTDHNHPVFPAVGGRVLFEHCLRERSYPRL